MDGSSVHQLAVPRLLCDGGKWRRRGANWAAAAILNPPSGVRAFSARDP
jgi:hypothetical protein